MPVEEYSAEELVGLADAAWATVTDRYPDAKRPEAKFVRAFTVDQRLPVIVGCLAELGFETAISREGGGYEFLNPIPEKTELAQYVCNVRFPVNKGEVKIASELTLSDMYDYFVNELTPCLEREGFTISAPTSKAEFVETWPHQSFNPYFDIDSNLPEAQGLAERCPHHGDYRQ